MASILLIISYFAGLLNPVGVQQPVVKKKVALTSAADITENQDAPIQEVFDYTCLYLSINPDNLDVYKGGFVRYGKVNKKKIQSFIDLAEKESMDLTDCNFSTN